MFQGSDLSFKCLASGSPAPYIRWLWWHGVRGSQSLTDPVRAHSKTLELTNITRDYEGHLVCEAYDGQISSITVEPVLARVALRVACMLSIISSTFIIISSLLDSPVVTSECSLVHTGVGQNFYLACSVTSRPRADITWLRGNRQVQKIDKRVEMEKKYDWHYLFINNATEDDFGEYVCKANNSIGTKSTNIIVVGRL